MPEPFCRRHANVLSIVVEVNRSLHMVEENGQRRPDFPDFSAGMQDAPPQLIAHGVSSLLVCLANCGMQTPRQFCNQTVVELPAETAVAKKKLVQSPFRKIAAKFVIET